ncbi:MAG: hypothetical protein GTN40_02265 [Candidatus Aenigmarchaeota archaeon]|nr:hypothetical protein [Candidatus Aenigmarchaeota archaeon]
MKKLKKRNKFRRTAIYIIIAVIALSALYYVSNYEEIKVTGSTIIGTKSKYDYSRTGNPEYYSLLPPKPADFDEIKYMWQIGIIRDNPERINESYWKQPEWFPQYTEGFVRTLENLLEAGNREPIWSLGIFDAQIYRIINQNWLQDPTEPTSVGHGLFEIKEDSVVVKHRFWVRAIPGAMKIFGVGLYTSYPEEGLLLSNARWGISEELIKQDTELAQKHLNIQIYEKESGKTEFNLGTYWPQLQADYIKEVWVETEIDKEIPKGRYIVQVDLVAPSREYQESQSLKYGLGYVDPNIGIYRGPSKFRLFIEII